MNIKDVADQIEKKAGVSILTLPVGRRFMTRAPDGRMVMIKAGEAWPIGEPDGSIVISLFQSDDDVRVYTLAAEAAGTGKEPPPPTRYTISKHQPAVFCEIMGIDTFINEIAAEWVMVDEDISSAERERASILDWLRGTAILSAPAPSLVLKLADQIEAEEHLEDDEDDEEDEGEKTVVPSESPAPS